MLPFFPPQCNMLASFISSSLSDRCHFNCNPNKAWKQTRHQIHSYTLSFISDMIILTLSWQRDVSKRKITTFCFLFFFNWQPFGRFMLILF